MNGLGSTNPIAGVINISLLCLCVSLNVIYIYRLTSKVDVALSALISSCARSVTLILMVFMVLKHRSYGVVASTTMSVFWIIFSAFSIILQRSLIMNYFNSSGKVDISDSVFIIDLIYYCLIYVQLILSVFTDKRDINHLQNDSDFEEATFISLITFSWFSKFVLSSVFYKYFH
ncbi:multidrug resistance-associated protein 1-like [Uloborus diversus]|uniref:multidrug resistance-associated protein 1-like n=1 Tax=Uloborus diversus TaxID=327109 RepID=UPI00240A964A|nr:multidrug resistance-associated protein 1-like [Uloborus diversus]